MSNGQNGNDEEDDLLFEVIDRYKLSITIDNKGSYTTSNNLEYLLDNYNNIVAENINSDRDIVIGIFDNNINTYIYSYNSEYDR